MIADYVTSVRSLQRLGDYVCLNLSCPNTRDGRGFFAERSRLRALLEALVVERPLFIKVAPFGGADELDSFLEAVDPFPFVSGFSVNLPPGDRPGMPGAVSGPPAAPAGLRTVTELHRFGRRPVIGSWRRVVGGRRLADDPRRRLARAGLHGAGVRGAGGGAADHAGPRRARRARRLRAGR